MRSKIFLFVILLFSSIFFLPLVTSSTIIFDKDAYALTETASATINCAGNEKNQAYTVVWSNDTGFEIPLANDTGNTLSPTSLSI